MAKKLLSLLTAFLMVLGLQAQEWTAHKEPPSIQSVNHAARLAAEILEAAGLKANFQIAEADVPNAMAVVHQGKRYVLYNPNFIDQLTRVTGTRWAAVSVLAHEIGHHLYPTKSGRLLATELESDHFSGYVLQRMGATLEEAQAAMQVLGTPYATSTHPAAHDRLSSIASGWTRAGGRVENNDDDEEVIVSRQPSNRQEPQEVYRERSLRERVLPDEAIAAVLQFNNDRRNEYYVTKKMNIVKFDGQNLEIIGKLASYDSYEYPYMLYDESGYRLYVHRLGEIVNREGKELGRLVVGASGT
jgi:predicted HD phosphohydrolase